MRLALREAASAYQSGEVPIGAVLVVEGRMIAAARNRVEELQDASAHAEMLCVRQAAAELGTWRLEGSTLYCTVEPCPMCLAALHAFRVSRLVYGTVNRRLGAVESAMCAGRTGGAMHPFHSLTATRGVLAADSAALMQRFFQRRRQGAPDVDKPRAAREQTERWQQKRAATRHVHQKSEGSESGEAAGSRDTA